MRRLNQRLAQSLGYLLSQLPAAEQWNSGVELLLREYYFLATLSGRSEYEKMKVSELSITLAYVKILDNI